jgi:hypothetical protein
MFGITNHQNNNGWRGKLETIKGLREKVKNYSTGAPGLRPFLEKELDEEIARLRPEIITGAIGEFRAAMENYMTTARKRDIFEQAERARWDRLKLAANREALQKQVDAILNEPDNHYIKSTKAEDLRAVYDEWQSGEVNEQRAAAELFSKLGDKAFHTAAKDTARELEHAAKEKLSELRTTQDLQAADANREQALSELFKKREQLLEAGRGLGEVPEPVPNADPDGDPTGGPLIRNELTQAYRQLQVVNSEVFIYPLDSPEMTGVYWNRMEQGE